MPDLMEFLGLNAPWQRYAACAWGDRDRLAPIAGGQPSVSEWDDREAAARELCAHCPVLEQCAAAADERGEQGVWGGSLRYRAGEFRGEYVVVPLIPAAAASRYDRKAVTGRIVRGRAPVCGAGR